MLDPIARNNIETSQEVIGDAPYVPTAPEGDKRKYLESLYKSIGQTPDPAGMAYWMGRDLEGADLRRHFRGAVGLPDVEFEQPATDYEDRRDYVATLYREVLGREPDAAGLDFWVESAYEGDDLRKQMRGAAVLENPAYEDPAYAAFMRGMRQREGTIEADRAARVRDLTNQQTLRNSQFDRESKLGLRKIDDNAESRGMYRSGGRIRNRADLSTNIALERGQSELNYTSQANEVNRNAATELANLSRQRDEQEVSARNRATDKSIQDTANAARL